MAVRCWHCGAALNKAAAGAGAQLQCVGCGAKLGQRAAPKAVAPLPRPGPDELSDPPAQWSPEPRGGGRNPVAFLLALLLFAGAGYCAVKGYQRVTTWDRAQGNITGLRIERPDRMFATVQFSAADGRVYRFEEPCAWGTQAGETVEVIYPLADPGGASVDGEISALLGNVGSWMGAAGLAALAFVCLSWWRHSA